MQRRHTMDLSEAAGLRKVASAAPSTFASALRARSGGAAPAFEALHGDVEDGPLHNPDIPVLAVTGKYPEIHFFRPDVGKMLFAMESAHGNALAMTEFRGSSKLAHAELAADDSEIGFIDPLYRTKVGGLPGHTNDVLDIHPIPSSCGPSELMASGSVDNQVRVWDTWRERMRTGFIGHEGWVWSVNSVPSRHWIVTSSQDRTVRFWDYYKETPVSNGSVRHAGIVNCVVPGPGGEESGTVLSCSLDKTVRMIGLDRMKVQKTFRCDTENFVLQVLPERSHMFFVGGGTGLVTLWDDRREREPVKKANLHKPRERVPVRDICWVGPGRYASCCSHGDDLSIQTWNEDLRSSSHTRAMLTHGPNYGLCCLVPLKRNRVTPGVPNLVKGTGTKILITDIAFGVRQTQKEAVAVRKRLKTLEERMDKLTGDVESIVCSLERMQSMMQTIETHIKDDLADDSDTSDSDDGK